jgi:F0F1-type ATP synthase assembly protein I
MVTRLTKSSAESIRTAGALSSVGLAFVFALAIGFWFGTVLDRWFGTTPLCTIVCFFLGLAAGVLNVVRIVKQAYPPSSAPPAGPPPPPDDRDFYDGGD